MIHLHRPRPISLARTVLPLTAAAAVLLGAAGPAHAAVGSSLAGFESGGFSEFSQTGITSGTLSVTTARAYEGSHAAKATYDGSTNNGYARAIENVSWPNGSDVFYGAAFYLPSGYKASLKGGNDILRWDNYGTYAQGADYGGVELWSDGKARLMLGKYTNDPSTPLTGTFDLPEGRWFWLEVHQRFSTSSGSALSEVYIDGQKVASSTAANSYGRTADRLRAGMVAISAGRQNVPLTLYFDRVSISPTQRGPLGSSPAPPPAPGDTTPPDTTITSGPTGTVASGSASFGFSATEQGSTFSCRLDGSAWTACTSPWSTSGLADGTHTFEVRATDRAGNVDASPATRTWTVQSASPAPTPAPGDRLASFEDGTLGDLDQASTLHGTLAPSTTHYYDGRYSAKATYTGGGGFARGVFDVSWPADADRTYGVALYLPSDFSSSLQGASELLRWDNYGAYGNGADYGGIQVWRDGKARLMLGKYTNDPATVLGSPISLPTGRWFWLEVHQRFSQTAGKALSEVYVDGVRQMSTTAANSYGRAADRVRYGIVSVDDARQTQPLSLWFDMASTGSALRWVQ